MRCSQPAVVLFDIDGTLITSGGAGRQAIILAFEQWLGRKDVTLDFSFAGMTDRLITRRGFECLGLPVDEPDIDAFLDVYLGILKSSVQTASTYGIHPGMVEALEQLKREPNVALGLGTGNVEVGARIKLERMNLNAYFAFGGFGCDGEIRSDLIAAGIVRGRERLGAPDAPALIIGDTPSDVQAAHANGARCLGVATGGATRAALEASGADAIVDNLGEPGALDLLYDLL